MITFDKLNMLVHLVALALANAAYANEEVGARQLQQFLREHKEPAGILHTSYGYPVTYDEANNGLDPDTSLLLNHYIYESMSSFSLERIPARVVHANGMGARGYFEVTHDVSNITNVKHFNTVGKRTPVLARFSTSTGEKGSSEVKERAKGCGIKFYTEVGNMDLTGLTTDVFFMKDPVDSSAAIHILKPNPRTGTIDPTMNWDFGANNEEALLGLTQGVSYMGQPKNYRTAAFHAVHTYQVENDKGEISFIRLNWFPEGGIQSLTNQEFVTLSGADPDMHSQDLYDAISNKTYPTWTLSMQVVSKNDIDKVKFDIFDVSMYWPEKCFPHIPIGKIVLDKHVENQFAEVEQASFNPGNLPPNIRGCDKIFEARTFIYRDSAIHRLGTGINKIPTNCPLNNAQTYNRDGSPPTGDNGGDSPNYYPNSFNGIVPVNKKLTPLYRPNTQPGATNLWQIADFLNTMSETDRNQTITLAGTVLAGVPKVVQDKILNLYARADTEIAKAIKTVITTAAASAASNQG